MPASRKGRVEDYIWGDFESSSLGVRSMDYGIEQIAYFRGLFISRLHRAGFHSMEQAPFANSY